MRASCLSARRPPPALATHHRSRLLPAALAWGYRTLFYSPWRRFDAALLPYFRYRPPPAFHTYLPDCNPQPPRPMTLYIKTHRYFAFRRARYRTSRTAMAGIQARGGTAPLGVRAVTAHYRHYARPHALRASWVRFPPARSSFYRRHRRRPHWLTYCLTRFSLRFTSRILPAPREKPTCGYTSLYRQFLLSSLPSLTYAFLRTSICRSLLPPSPLFLPSCKTLVFTQPTHRYCVRRRPERADRVLNART